MPTAVPPIPRSDSSGSASRTRPAAAPSAAAQPDTSWPSRIGVASMRCVRPDFTIRSQRRAFPSKVRASDESASITPGASSSAASRIAVGTTSFVDCAMFTSSFGSTSRSAPRRPPRSSVARFASTSFTFMWCEVPAPAW